MIYGWIIWLLLLEMDKNDPEGAGLWTKLGSCRARKNAVNHKTKGQKKGFSGTVNPLRATVL
ncbi:MAG: hypothetical protein JJU00_05005 [Opitutales bacterium]|nr:hypothetical protein [Opitutales bacterium]